MMGKLGQRKDEVRMPTLAGTVCMGLVVMIVGAQVSIAAPKEPESKIANVAKGEKIFIRHCAGCHGSEGNGEGYLLLGPEPANLTRPTTKKKSDAILLQTIHEGKPNMPSWKTRLSEADSRAVLAYIRTLKK
jgi:mono/diheme cytochrome c family protein